MQTRTIKSNNKFKTGWIFLIVMTLCFFLVTGQVSVARANTEPVSLSTWFVEMDRYAKGAHGSLGCETCHGSMMPEGITKSGSTISHSDPNAPNFLVTATKKKFDYATCKTCHKTAHERFLNGAHAVAAAKEKSGDPLAATNTPLATSTPSVSSTAPVCGECHSAHYTISRRSRTAIGKQMTQTCGTCHPDQKKSYLANYHGRAGVNLAYEKAAFCTDCHGAHTVVSLKDGKEAQAVCRRCHIDAGPEFANIIIHDSKTNPDLKSDIKKAGLKWVHLLAGLSLTFVISVLAFFYMHTGLLMLRKLHEKLRRHK